MINPQEEIQCCITQCDQPLDSNYWEAQWQNKTTGWNIGHAAPVITQYMAQYENKNAAILIPGCGNAYEAEFLLANGFTNITLMDIAPKAVELLQNKFKGRTEVTVLCEDYFHHNGNYDLIIEQTFFCAIPPARRKEYAEKAAALLNQKGKIIGVLFDKKFDKPGPPFGGCPCEYKPVFEPHFHIAKMEECYNSIAARAGSEVFIQLVKK